MKHSKEPSGGSSSHASHERGEHAALASESEVREAYLLVIRGELQALRSEAPRYPARSLARIVIDAAIAQNEGRMDRCRASYERALKAAGPVDLPYVVDVFAPLLLMSGEADRYEDLRDSCEEDTELAGPFAALDAVSAARRGDFAASLSAEHRAYAFADHCDDDTLNGRILQRLAYAALHRRDFAHAAEAATRSARTFEVVGAHRSAAISYSIVYSVHHTATGDFDRAEIYAGKIVEAARRSGDLSLENLGLVAQYHMACECGEESSASSLRARIDSLALPEQYAERFARGVGDVILNALRGDLRAFYANAVLLRDVLAPDRPTMALASALRSLGAAATGDFDEARRSSRNALGLASLNEKAETAYNVRYRRLARALAASTCLLIGDEVRAQRATARHFAEDDYGLLVLLRIAQGSSSESVPRRIRGYARIVAAVRDAIRQSYRSSQLSEAEFAILTLLAQGLSAPQIAGETGRSVHTIRAHTRAIIAKFGVRGRAAAIAYAMKNGLLS